ncbi:E3 ubiquitin-protein ligase Bre1 isoform X2 [Microplitis demolitor]|uniref:E3 ubiquitin-protein ligase Bre1 isoform X2 n=1 Tax=Microplitis demolitor TaxID=69319 RepID=UPI00235B6D2D|nr:E3 ubiquitin-protein ligase Bre1 isoform X2 [Microplitis demolitor]
MEEDIDIYGDLINFNHNECENCHANISILKSKATELEDLIQVLEKEIENLKGSNTTLKINLSSLLKTAKNEIVRKDRIINELRQQLDNYSFRRSSNRLSNISKSNHVDTVSKYKNEHDKVISVKKEEPIIQIKETVYCNPRNTFITDNEGDKHINFNDTPVSTIYGQRLKKKIRQEKIEKDNEQVRYFTSTSITNANSEYDEKSKPVNLGNKENRYLISLSSSKIDEKLSRKISKRSNDTISDSSSDKLTKLDDVQRELEETRELANNRLQELDKLHQQHRDALKEVEKLKMDIRQLPESVIVETTEYKCLQSQFSVLYNESMQLKTQLDDTRQQLQSSKNSHLRHIEMMESEELMAQKKLRGECIQLEDILAKLRKEYEMLRIEFEQNLAANEQTGPINREMRHLITSLQNHNQQLKGEVHRYKRKYKEASTEVPKLRKEIEDLKAKLGQQVTQETKEGNSSDGSGKEEDSSTYLSATIQIKDEGIAVIKRELTIDEEIDSAEKSECESKNTSDTHTLILSTLKKGKDIKREKDVKKEVGVKTEHKENTVHRIKDSKVIESEIVRDLKAQLKKTVNEMKEMKLLLDMYKSVGKEQRDKVQLMAAERKIRTEVEELCQQLKKIQENKREERTKLADEDAQIKIKKLEEQAYNLQKQVASQKQVQIKMNYPSLLLNKNSFSPMILVRRYLMMLMILKRRLPMSLRALTYQTKLEICWELRNVDKRTKLLISTPILLLAGKKQFQKEWKCLRKGKSWKNTLKRVILT